MDLHWTQNMALLFEGSCQGREQRPGSLPGEKKGEMTEQIWPTGGTCWGLRHSLLDTGHCRCAFIFLKIVLK